jgi:hypothetical protein
VGSCSIGEHLCGWVNVAVRAAANHIISLSHRVVIPATPQYGAHIGRPQRPAASRPLHCFWQITGAPNPTIPTYCHHGTAPNTFSSHFVIFAFVFTKTSYPDGLIDITPNGRAFLLVHFWEGRGGAIC